MIKSKVFRYLFVVFSFIGIWLVNYHFHYESLWLLFLLPSISTVILFPKWEVVVLVGVMITIVKTATELWIHLASDTVSIGFQNLAVSEMVWWILFIFTSYLRITNIKLVKELEELALTDPLTRTFNRRYLNLYMEKALLLAKREKNQLTILLFDIDFFKKVNDSYGHDAGDMILQRLVKMLKRKIRESDVLVRMGGEEFLIVLPSTSLNEGYQLAEWLRKTVEKQAFMYDRDKISVTISVGVARYNHEQEFRSLISKADQALYQAKENGRNQVVVADE